MKKNIKDYRTAEGKFGIYCKNATEFDSIARLINPHHGAIGNYQKDRYDVIFVYEDNQNGWLNLDYAKENNNTIINASEFLEETEVEPLFIN